MSEEEIQAFIRNQNKFMREFRTGIEMIESVYSKMIDLEKALGFQFASTIDQADETASAEIETPAPVAQPPDEPVVKIPYPIISTILEVKPALTFEKVKALAEAERAKAGGLLTMEAAYHLVASNLGVHPEEPTETLEVGKWVTVEGTLKDSPELKKGDRQDGSQWKRSSFRLDLPTETVRVTLWDDYASAGMEFAEGDQMRLEQVVVKAPYGESSYRQLNSGKYTKVIAL